MAVDGVELVDQSPFQAAALVAGTEDSTALDTASLRVRQTLEDATYLHRLFKG